MRPSASIVAEKAGFDDEADAEHGVEFLVGEEAFAVAVVVLQEEELVVAFEDAVVELDGGVVVKLPSFAFDEVYGQSEAPVLGVETGSNLIDAAVVENVLVLDSVDDRNPNLSVYHYLWIDHDASSHTDLVP